MNYKGAIVVDCLGLQDLPVGEFLEFVIGEELLHLAVASLSDKFELFRGEEIEIDTFDGG